MGLDMYLEAEKYISGYDFYPEETTKFYHDLVETLGVKDVVDPHTPSATVSFTVGYWRKANHIHQWFVDNVQEGKDECQRSYIEREQLQQLRDTCQKVLDATKLVDGEVCVGERATATGWEKMMQPGKVIEDASVAQELLPTQEGFFFGGTEYDEWYLQDVQFTIEQIDRALTLGDEWEFYYQASW